MPGIGRFPVRNRYIVRSRISEARFRRFARCVAADLTVVPIAQLTGLNRNTVNRLLACLRERRPRRANSNDPAADMLSSTRATSAGAGSGAGRAEAPAANHRLRHLQAARQSVAPRSLRAAPNPRSPRRSAARSTSARSSTPTNSRATTAWWTWGTRSICGSITPAASSTADASGATTSTASRASGDTPRPAWPASAASTPTRSPDLLSGTANRD